MKAFIPFDDDWFEHPERMPGELVPYQVGMVSRRVSVLESQRTGPMRPLREKVSPMVMPSRAAVPADSSST